MRYWISAKVDKKGLILTAPNGEKMKICIHGVFKVYRWPDNINMETKNIVMKYEIKREVE